MTGGKTKPSEIVVRTHIGANHAVSIPLADHRQIVADAMHLVSHPVGGGVLPKENIPLRDRIAAVRRGVRVWAHHNGELFPTE